MFQKFKNNALLVLSCAFVAIVCMCSECTIDTRPPYHPEPPRQDSVCVVLTPEDVDIDITDVDTAIVVMDLPEPSVGVHLNIFLLSTISESEQSQAIMHADNIVGYAHAKMRDEYGLPYNIVHYSIETLEDDYSVEELMKMHSALDNLSPLLSTDVINIIVTKNSVIDMAKYGLNSVTLGFVFSVDGARIADNTINDHWLFSLMALSWEGFCNPTTYVHEEGHRLGLEHCCTNDISRRRCNIMLPWDAECASEFSTEQLDIMRDYMDARKIFKIGAKQ